MIKQLMDSLHDSHNNMSDMSNTATDTLDALLIRWMPVVLLTITVLKVLQYPMVTIVCYIFMYICTLAYNCGCFIWYSYRFGVSLRLQASLVTEDDVVAKEDEIRRCINRNAAFPNLLDILHSMRVGFGVLSLAYLIYAFMR